MRYYRVKPEYNNCAAFAFHRGGGIAYTRAAHYANFRAFIKELNDTED